MPYKNKQDKLKNQEKRRFQQKVRAEAIKEAFLARIETKTIYYTIYAICCNSNPLIGVYIGSSKNIENRINQHKQNSNNIISDDDYKVYSTIKSNGGWTNWSVIVLDVYPCKDKTEASIYERFWYDTLNSTLNSMRPSIFSVNKTQKWYIDGIIKI